MVSLKTVLTIIKKSESLDEFLGQKLSQLEITRLTDFYSITEQFSLEDTPEFLYEIYSEMEVKDVGSRLAMGLMCDLDYIGNMIMDETDDRLLTIFKQRVQTEEKGLDIDSNIL